MTIESPIRCRHCVAIPGHRGRRLSAAVSAGIVAAGALLHVPADAQDIDSRRLENPRDGEWIMDGRRYDAQRYSPLALINESNVGELGLTWFHELETMRGVEATPLAFDGVLYNISA